MALAARFTDVDQVVVSIAHDAYRCTAYQGNHSHLAGGETQGGVLAFLSHQLCAVARGTDQLAAVAGIQLDVVHHGTYGNLGQRQTVAHSHFRVGPVHDLHAVGQSLRSDDIGLLAVCVADQGDIGGPVGIVLNADDRCGDAVLVSLEIDDSVFSSASAALMSHGNLALVVAAGMLL